VLGGLDPLQHCCGGRSSRGAVFSDTPHHDRLCRRAVRSCGLYLLRPPTFGISVIGIQACAQRHAVNTWPVCVTRSVFSLPVADDKVFAKQSRTQRAATNDGNLP